MAKPLPASDESSVGSLYRDPTVAEGYLTERFVLAWSALLHRSQVSILNDVIARHGIASALELAPGPARIAVDLRGLSSGIMVEQSLPMIELARERLRRAGAEGIWRIHQASAFDLSFLDRQFRLIFTFRFVRHFESEDRRRLYAEVFGRLENQGFFVLDVVNRSLRQRLDAESRDNPRGLAVYDATYDEGEIRREMEQAGFEIVALHPVIRHFHLQARISYTLGRRLPGFARFLVDAIERSPSREPLEWVAVCRRRMSLLT